MQATQALAVLAHASVAFAGFSGIVAAFRRRDLPEWSPLERFRFRFMVEFSLATLALSLVPLFLDELGLSEAAVWRASSVLLGGGALSYLVRSALRLRLLLALGEPVNRGLAAVSLFVGAVIAVSAFVNVTGFFAHPSGVYLSGVGGCLFVSSAMFAQLLLANAKPGSPRADS